MLNQSLQHPWPLVLAVAVGLALGLIFFGGLWWTIRRSLSARQPAVWILGSLLARMGVTLTGFYWVAGGDWQRLLACLAGFVIARAGVTWLTRQQDSSPQSLHLTPNARVQEARHAP
jgi:F1F0 ATPase subunit 2